MMALQESIDRYKPCQVLVDTGLVRLLGDINSIKDIKRWQFWKKILVDNDLVNILVLPRDDL